METLNNMEAFLPLEAGWQIALAGIVVTFVVLLVLRLIIQGVQAVLSRFGLDVEELTYIPPQMPTAAAPPVSQDTSQRVEAPASPTATPAGVEETVGEPYAESAAAPDGEMEAIVAAIAYAICEQEAAPAAAPEAAASSLAHGIRSAWCMAGRLNLIHREPRKSTR